MKPYRKKQGIVRTTEGEKKPESDFRLIFVLAGALVLSLIIVWVLIVSTPA
jgi:predicted nucleic acid-binding Zn ribbon protein